MTREQNNKRRRVAILLAVFCILASVKVMATPSIRRPVVHFIHFYQQADDMGLWERFVYSLIEFKSSNPS
jgi:hypothetical protein